MSLNPKNLISLSKWIVLVYLEKIRYIVLSNLPRSINNLIGLTELDLGCEDMKTLPESISNHSNLEDLRLDGNQLSDLPQAIGNLSNLTKLSLINNQLTSLPDSLGNLSNLSQLDVGGNRLTSLPESIGNLANLEYLNLGMNQLVSLPDCLGDLSSLSYLNLEHNQLTNLPKAIANLSNLVELNIDNNPLIDLSILQSLPKLKYLEDIYVFGVSLPRRYWTKLSEWKPEWLLDEKNAAIRQRLIAQIGYEKTCEVLNAITLDIWREYTLLKITNIESFEAEPMVLLKMTCPSTAHIHILRVPPDLVSAAEAITWVNHGIHPDKFTIQT